MSPWGKVPTYLCTEHGHTISAPSSPSLVPQTKRWIHADARFCYSSSEGTDLLYEVQSSLDKLDVDALKGTVRALIGAAKRFCAP